MTVPVPHRVGLYLAVVQFFTWFALFCMWIYFTPAVATKVFGGEPGSPTYVRGNEWAGVCFSVYNGTAFVFAFVLLVAASAGAQSADLDAARRRFEALRRDLSRVRTGRASLAILDDVRVDYYGTPTPLNQVASCSTPDS